MRANLGLGFLDSEKYFVILIFSTNYEKYDFDFENFVVDLHVGGF